MSTCKQQLGLPTSLPVEMWPLLLCTPDQRLGFLQCDRDPLSQTTSEGDDVIPIHTHVRTSAQATPVCTNVHVTYVPLCRGEELMSFGCLAVRVQHILAVLHDTSWLLQQVKALCKPVCPCVSHRVLAAGETRQPLCLAWTRQ